MIIFPHIIFTLFFFIQHHSYLHRLCFRSQHYFHKEVGVYVVMGFQNSLISSSKPVYFLVYVFLHLSHGRQFCNDKSFAGVILQGKLKCQIFAKFYFNM